MFKDSFFKSNYKPKSFFSDSKKKKEEKEFSFTLPAYVKPTGSPEASAPKTDSVAPSIGSQIKSRLRSVLSKKYGDLDTKNLFDDINDKDVENNIGTAENAIKTNIDKGFLSKDYFKKFPNLRDGLALSYAAADKGNSKEARKDYLSAALSAVGAIPIVGELADASKLAKTTDKAIDAIRVTDDVADATKALKKVSPSKLTQTHKPTLSKNQYNDLVENIRKNGIIEPIKYVEHNGTKYVVDGHHRLRAAKQLGLNEIPIQKVSLPYKGYNTIDDLLWLE